MARLLLFADSNFLNNIGDFPGRKIKNLEVRSCKSKKELISELTGINQGVVVVACLTTRNVGLGCLLSSAENPTSPFASAVTVCSDCRLYAHTIASFLDQDSKYFSHRILSRDECFDNRSKTANLS